MANGTLANVPTRTVQLDRPRTMALTLGAARRMREKGVDLGVLMQKEGLEAFDAIGTLFWCALIEEDRADVTPEQLEDMIPFTRVPEIHVMLLELMAAEQEQVADVGKGSASSPTPKTRTAAKKTAKRTTRRSE